MWISSFAFILTYPLFCKNAVVLMICVTRVAKKALEKALAESEGFDGINPLPQLPVTADAPGHLHEPLIIRVDTSQDDHEK